MLYLQIIVCLMAYYVVGVAVVMKFCDCHRYMYSKYEFGEAFFWPILVVCLGLELVLGGFRQLLSHICEIFRKG